MSGKWCVERLTSYVDLYDGVQFILLVVYFAVAPSIWVVHLVTETRKWALTELRST